ncbi:MAG: hypothetical protein IKC28_07120 [Clostridia bacterium]|nr:hypothetical protein [Clostridia bacterium]
MKLKKVLGNILTVLGCIVMLIGLLAYVLPQIDNHQLQLVLSTFQTPSSHWLIQLMNDGMNFAMENCFLMLLIGSAVTLFGVLLTFSARTDEEAQRMQTKKRPVQAAVANAAYMRPQPAAAPAESVAHTMEENPFARYAKRDSLPKSTYAPSASRPAAEKPAAQQNNDVQDDILTIWDQIQHQPEEEDNLQVRTTHVEDDQAYRRPTEDEITVVDTIAQATVPPEPVLPVHEEPAVYEELPAYEPEPEVFTLQEVSPVREAVPPPAAPAPMDAPKPRPVIRSTFPTPREQPTPIAQFPEEESVSIETNVAAPLQPTSRIKSTMGRKR